MSTGARPGSLRNSRVLRGFALTMLANDNLSADGRSDLTAADSMPRQIVEPATTIRPSLLRVGPLTLLQALVAALAMVCVKWSYPRGSSCASPDGIKLATTRPKHGDEVSPLERMGAAGVTMGLRCLGHTGRRFSARTCPARRLVLLLVVLQGSAWNTVQAENIPTVRNVSTSARDEGAPAKSEVIDLAVDLRTEPLPRQRSQRPGLRSASPPTSSPAVLLNMTGIDRTRVTRRLAVIHVQPGTNTLQAALNGANAGDELILADGIYTGDGTSGDGISTVLDISKSVTIRALNVGGVVLDGQNARRVISISAGIVELHGLSITRGSGPWVRSHARLLKLTRWSCHIWQVNYEALLESPLA